MRINETEITKTSEGFLLQSKGGLQALLVRQPSGEYVMLRIDSIHARTEVARFFNLVEASNKLSIYSLERLCKVFAEENTASSLSKLDEHMIYSARSDLNKAYALRWESRKEKTRLLDSGLDRIYQNWYLIPA